MEGPRTYTLNTATHVNLILLKYVQIMFWRALFVYHHVPHSSSEIWFKWGRPQKNPLTGKNWEKPQDEEGGISSQYMPYCMYKLLLQWSDCNGKIIIEIIMILLWLTVKNGRNRITSSLHKSWQDLDHKTSFVDLGRR